MPSFVHRIIFAVEARMLGLNQLCTVRHASAKQTLQRRGQVQDRLVHLYYAYYLLNRGLSSIHLDIYIVEHLVDWVLPHEGGRISRSVSTKRDLGGKARGSDCK